jgi:outer membrane protein assembly factor BamD
MMKSLPRSQALAAVACLALLLGLTGCRTGGVQDDPVLRLSADEAFTQGKAYLETEKYAKARNHLTHAFELEPNSRQGREALLMVADSYYLDGGLSNFIQAEAKYRDFLNRFPTSDQAAYAQFQIANSLARRIQRSDRDQTPTLNALSAYEELIRLYPTSQYAEEADEQMAVVRENLAAHELTVGKFNYEYKNYLGAIHRLEKLLENYPDFSHRDQALLLLGKSYAESSNVLYWLKAKETYDRLRREYPDSRYARNIPELPPQPKPRGDAEVAEGEEPGGEGDAPSEGAPAAEDMEPVGGGR